MAFATSYGQTLTVSDTTYSILDTLLDDVILVEENDRYIIVIEGAGNQYISLPESENWTHTGVSIDHNGNLFHLFNRQIGCGNYRLYIYRGVDRLGVHYSGGVAGACISDCVPGTRGCFNTRRVAEWEKDRHSFASLVATLVNQLNRELN